MNQQDLEKENDRLQREVARLEAEVARLTKLAYVEIKVPTRLLKMFGHA